MFVRKKKNRSGSTSVVVVDKRGGCFREVKTIGVSSEGKLPVSGETRTKKIEVLRLYLCRFNCSVAYDPQ
jgi:hypothetical protein